MKKKLGEVGLLGLCEKNEKWGNGGQTKDGSGGAMVVVGIGGLVGGGVWSLDYGGLLGWVCV